MLFQGLKYVYAVYEAGSFSQAAKNLFISQPSLSANVKREEAAVGYPIFDRSTKPLQLTACGREYIRAAEQIMAVGRQFNTYLEDLEDLQTGALSIGGSNLFASWILPPLLADFSRRFPKVRIELVEETSAELSRLLQDGRIDFMMDNADLDETVYDRRFYKEEHLLLAVPSEFEVNRGLTEYQVPLECIMDGTFGASGLPAVPLSRFAGEPFILMKPDSNTGERARLICRENGFTPKVLFSLDQQMTTYNITSSGLGISFISDTLISRVPFHDHITYYRLSGSNTRRNICLYWKSSRYQSRAMQAFLEGIP